MKVFITGASGFLGTNLVHLLIQQGAEISAIRRPDSSLAGFNNMNIDWHQGDLLDRDSLMQACPVNVDYIFHVGADTSMWSAKNAQQTKVNINGTANIIEVALAKRAKRLIHTSSIASYGIHENHTITEHSEQKGGQCFANYYKTKYQSEQLIKAAVNSKNLDAVILNPCHLVGPWDFHNWSQMLTLVAEDRLPGIPPGFGSFCHIKEVARAHLQAAKQGIKGENYILSGVDAYFVEFVQVIGELLNKKVANKAIPKWLLKVIAHTSVFFAHFTHKEPDMTPEKVLIVCDHLKVSSRKAQEVLGYRTDISLKEMLSDCYDWMRQQKI